MERIFTRNLAWNFSGHPKLTKLLREALKACQGYEKDVSFFFFFSIVKMHGLFSINAHTFQYTYLFIDLGTHVTAWVALQAKNHKTLAPNKRRYQILERTFKVLLKFVTWDNNS